MDEKTPPAGGQLPLRGIRKAVLFLAIVTVFAGLFGCSARPEPPPGELTVVSAAGGRMSRTESYSFSAIRKDGVWMFSTRCYADREKFYVELEDCPMTDEEAGELLRIVAEEALIHTVHSFRKPLLARIFPPRDAAMDSTLLRFADGTEYDGEVSIGSDLTAFFYRLAEQYGREASPSGRTAMPLWTAPPGKRRTAGFTMIPGSPVRSWASRPTPLWRSTSPRTAACSIKWA